MVSKILLLPRQFFHDKSRRRQDELIKDNQRIPQHDTGVLFEYALTSINSKLKHCKKGNGQDFTDRTDAKCVVASGIITKQENGEKLVNPDVQRARVSGKNKKGGLRVCVYVPFNDTFRYFFLPKSLHQQQNLSIQFEKGELTSKLVENYEIESIELLAKMKGNSELVVNYDWV